MYRTPRDLSQTSRTRSLSVTNLPIAKGPPTAISRRTSTLTLCDLASVDRSVYEHKAFIKPAEDRQAGGKLNQSLSCLTRIIALLSERARKGILPFRDSTLTWILKDKLNGNCNTVLIATISSDTKDREETLSTLLFAERARNIRTHYQPNVQNETPIVAMLRELTDTFAELQRQRVEIRRLLTPGHPAEGIGLSFGTSLVLDSEFFGGPCMIGGKHLSVYDTHELQQLDREIEARVNEHRTALYQIVHPLWSKPEETRDTFACIMHQLGVFRVNVLSEVLPEEYRSACKAAEPIDAPPLHGKGDDKCVDSSDNNLAVDHTVESAESDSVSSCGSKIRDGEDELQYRVRLKNLQRQHEWNTILHAGDSSYSCEETRNALIRKQVPVKKERVNRTVHVCKQSFSEWDTEYIDTNYGAKDTEFIFRRYTSVNRACLVAEDGDIVEVHEGIWHETITIVRDIDIVGKGSRDRIVIKSTSTTPAVTMHTVRGILQNLTIHQHGGECGVLVRGGCGTIKACSVSAFRARSGIKVTTNANPVIIESYIHDCSIRGSGVLIEGGGCGILQNNVVTRCGSAGIVVEGKTSHPLIRNNQIVGGKGAGIALSHGARGIVEENVIENNACAGVLIEEKANPTVRGNTIRYNLGGGVIITSEHTTGLLEKNIISDNSEREVLVQSNATPQIKWNTFLAGSRLGVSAPFGLVVNTEAKCLALENEFINYEGCGAACRAEESWLYAVGNKFIMRLLSAGGVSIFDMGSAQLRYNSFYFEGEAANRTDKCIVNTTGRSLAVKGNKVNEPAVIPSAEEALMVPYKFELEVFI